MAKNARKTPRKSPRKSPRDRRRVLAWIAAGSMALVVALVAVALVIWIRRPDTPPIAEQPSGGVPPTSSVPPRIKKPRPAYQDASCPDVQLVSVPGTWETSPTDDPLNPTQFPIALLLTVTRPIAEQFDASRVQTYTVPYTAQFHNPLSADKQMSYNDSRAEGTRATVKAMTEMNDRCPLTSYVLVGFSQGAVIAGDVASDIGNGRGPVDEDLVLGVTLIADGRRQVGPGSGVDVPPTPPGQGAEVTLHELPILSGMGLTMTGAREGGFGDLDQRTNEICARGDLICAAPREAFSVGRLPATLETLAGGAGQPVHAMYATVDFWNHDGQSATQWTLNWARDLVDNAPHPPHG
ncbi:cutinase family protein [Mycolicibacter longobardus]|uniref:Cutinase n=1 Tax=Mycolicibacter longobardus TaxID=1108812 RepID=A0A1X1YH38_9MYCO|nr:cutinase family protein [Mycolicibacter longobardus]MCV7382358.1 cutinase family protein [Mycolicibacter longobardus]ORW10437.1 cutinase [Mycolicibacter longobardus]